MSIYSKLAEAGSRVQRGMGERYLNDCVTLLLDVECCHDFGTKHLDEYAEQPRPCVIYAESVHERVQFQSVCVCACLRE